MSGLVPIHHRILEKFAVAVGCTFVRQTASHRVYWRNDQTRPIIIPVYRQVPVFVVRNILRQLNISTDEFHRIIRDL
ncbi:MAG: type II toxin-antitoxin system HicA family toxin [Deltaproteobacteria bacterium]|nr:type II toxin-antitoxin system HicA family toxin [Deltaproteobacteria bacterium]